MPNTTCSVAEATPEGDAYISVGHSRRYWTLRF